MNESRTLNNRYILEAELGRGGMGVVYRGRDLKMNRQVAIKVLPAEFAHDAQFLARFNSEINNTSQLQHQHIVSIYDMGVDDGTYYYVMQYVEGQDLKSYLARHEKLSPAEACRILAPIAAALDYAHGRGIVHRDIKPENILIDRYGTPSLTDFGIARSLEGTRMTTGMVGTPEYMSPEQAKGEEIDGRSDQYSLAIVAYEMLTGTTPFRSSTAQPWAVVNKHISEAPIDPRSIVPTLGSHEAQAILQGLSKAAGQRFASCTEFVEAMRGEIQAKGAAPSKKRVWIPMMALLGIFFVAGAILIFAGVGSHKRVTLLPGDHTQTPSATAGTPATDVSPSTVKTNPQDGAELIEIPAGEFLMGSSADDKDADPSEKPQHSVYLDAYYIYKNDVTVAQYRKFCNATGRAMPGAPSRGWIDTHPIVNVSWDDASAYAQWAGAALPTEAQWEKAARGTDGRIYPWGNDWDASKCSNSVGHTAEQTSPVGSFPSGASPYGVLDMAGNVWQWCADWYGADYYQTSPAKNPTGPATGTVRVLRGGSWYNGGAVGCRGAYRSSYYPDSGSDYFGFRCVALSPGR